MGKAYSSCYHHKKKRPKNGQRQDTDHYPHTVEGFQTHENLGTEHRKEGKQCTDDFDGIFFEHKN